MTVAISANLNGIYPFIKRARMSVKSNQKIFLFNYHFRIFEGGISASLVKHIESSKTEDSKNADEFVRRNSLIN